MDSSVPGNKFMEYGFAFMVGLLFTQTQFLNVRAQGCQSQDLVFIVDTADWNYVREELAEFVRSLSIHNNNIRIGVIAYGEQSGYFPLVGNETLALTMTRSFQPISGMNGPSWGLLRALKVFDRRPSAGERPNNAVLFINGSLLSTAREIQLIQNNANFVTNTKNATIYIVGLGATATQLNNLTSDGTGRKIAIYSATYTSLRTFFGGSTPGTGQVRNTLCRTTIPPVTNIPPVVTDPPNSACIRVDVAFVVEDSFYPSQDETSDNIDRPLAWLIPFLDRVVISQMYARIALILYGSTVQFSALSDSRTTVENSVRTVRRRGGTPNLVVALDSALEVFDAEADRQRVAILLIRTLPTTSGGRQQAISRSSTLKNQNVAVYVFAAGNADVSTARALASPGNATFGYYFAYGNIGQFSTIGDDIVLAVCLNQIRPLGNATDPSFRKACQIADVAFVVDASGSISDPPDGSPGKYNQHLSFCSSVAEKLPVGATGSHIGLVVFADTGRVVFNLNTYMSSGIRTIQSAILAATYPGGVSNTSGGLWVAQNKLFSGQPGDRAAIPDVIVLLTDGRSTRDEEYLSKIIQQLQDSGVRIFTAGITDFMSEERLRVISSPPRMRNKNFFIANGPTQLSSYVNTLVTEICFPENSSTESVRPVIGPQAGGTSVTVRSADLAPGQTPVVFIGRFQCFTKELALTAITCETQAVLSNDLNIPLPVRVRWANGSELDTATTFTYRQNPTITNVDPRYTIISGGILLSVRGTNLDAVSRPLLLVYLIYQQRELTRFSSLCSIQDSDTMLCYTPPITFLDADGRLKPEVLPNSRRRRQADDTDLVNFPSSDVRFEMGFLLDSSTTFERLSISLPNQAEILVYVDPSFRMWTTKLTFRRFSPINDEILEIEGMRLTSGLNPRDYTVKVGLSDCTGITTTSDRLTCTAPTQQPLKDVFIESDCHVVQVIIGRGYLRFRIGLLRYHENLFDYAPARYGLVGGLIAVCLIIVLTACICHRVRSSKSHDQDAPPIPRRQAQEYLYNVAEP